MSDATSLGHTPASERWEFDAEVTRVFDDMLERSIPQYHAMRRTVFELGRRFIGRPDEADPWVVDLGCSRGEAIAAFVEEGWAATGYEISDPMLEAAHARFEREPRVRIVGHDLRDPLPPIHGPQANLVLSILTLIFTPINHRQRIVRDAYEMLLPGGAMIVVEKVLGRGATLDRVMVDLYHDTKEAAGYTREEIDRKALALEGVQVPVTSQWNRDLLRDAGFREVDTFWRWCNFEGIIGVK